ncbi:unnamed protein product [Ceratitis capitata]|uniref:(Mediterranean fruit fly) hypothetical protein n=1 Tax=Ceratitis capitata TaxID=7213 RepID=A0A811VMK3_CERCA|nr:unnamed protein product [Ceratitis capitata]
MTDKIILYGLDKSPPVRAVLLTLKALNIDYEYVSVNPLKGEQKTEDYLKKNPSHTIPLLEVNGRHIADSHAIIAFLASKYGKDDKLYPKDLYQRAVVDQRLHYENGGIFSNVIRKHLRPLGMNQYTQEDAEAAIKDIIDVYDVLEAYLSENKYIAVNT